MPLKLCILSPKMPWPPRDGGALAVLALATGLAAQGAEVSLLACNTHKHYFPPSKLPKELTAQVHVEAVDVDTRIKPLKALYNLLFTRKPYVAERFESKSFEQRLVSLLQNKGPQIVQLESPYMGAYIDVIRKHSGAKIALRAHNIENQIWKRRAMQNKNPLLKWYFQSLSRRVKAFEIRAAQKADTLLPITKGDGEYFRQMAGAGHQLVCPAGIDKALLKANTDNDKVCRKGLFFIGALDWGPNQEGLKWFIDKVWPKLQQAEKNRMDIAGRNAPLWLEKRIKASGIHYHGEVENAYAFMGNYQVMLVPLLSGSGLRVKIVEAMAMGKCVVTTSIGAEGTGARHGKELIIADTPGEFARASMRLCSDPALAKKIGNKAREFAHEHFDKEKIAGKLYAFYQNMRLND